MPILPLETFLYPAELLQAGTADGGDSCWWVLHTRPRAEKSLARRLLTLGQGFFLPLYPRQAPNRGRLVTSHLPLFPGYVFLRGDADARLAALTTNLVANVLPVIDQHRLQADLERVHGLMTTGADLTPEAALLPGAAVEIVHGPLTGMCGKVLRRGSRLRFFVEVQLLQQGVSVEIESWMIRTADQRLQPAVGHH